MDKFSLYINKLFNDNPKLLKLICFAVIFVILIAGLWPFNFFPSNKVKWLQDRSGVRVYGQGIILSSYPGWNEQKLLFPDRAITVELWLHPRQETSNLPSILTLYDGEIPDIFLIGQWRSHLVIRSRPAEPRDRKPGKLYQEIGLRNAFPKSQDVFITVTSNKWGSLIFMNGKLAKSYPHHRLLAGASAGNIRLIIGNSPTGQGYWSGDILGIAVYNRALMPDEIVGNYLSWMQNDPYAIKKEKHLIGLYLFYEREGKTIHNIANSDDTLTIPDIFKPERRVVLSLPWREEFQWNLSFIQDVTLNILGFIPFGFFICGLLLKETNRQRITVYIVITIIGMGFSLAIELTQAYLPTRDSSLTDLVTNTVGTIVGAVLFPVSKK
jgi:hypothetical protein